MLYLCRFKPLRDHLRGFLIAAWAGDKIAEFSFPEISFHFPLRPWFFFVSPAYAGKSWTARAAASACWDHPRVCGEKISTSAMGAGIKGSPPRMRGKARRGGLVLKDDGITPAYAGKSKQSVIPVPPHWDHPRMCGEKSVSIPWSITSQGSPPHVRGKVHSGSHTE